MTKKTAATQDRATIDFDIGWVEFYNGKCEITVTDGSHADGDVIQIPPHLVPQDVEEASAFCCLLVRIHSGAKDRGIEIGKTAACEAARKGDVLDVKTGRNG
jgi:hypothetical protein